MKKLLVPIIILILIIIGGYVLYKYYKKHSVKTVMQQAQPTTNVFTSLKDALMNKTLSVSCDYTDDKGNHTIAYIKAGAVRANITSQQPSTTTNMIMKDKKIYFWTDGKTQGMMITMPSVTPTQPTGTMQDNTSSQNPSKDIMDSIEKFKEHCKAGVVADSLFTVPTDVTFSDFSKMMPPHEAMPPVTGMPSINPSNYQQMMQQYGQPQ